jgi:hypothetical protein
MLACSDPRVLVSRVLHQDLIRRVLLRLGNRDELRLAGFPLILAIQRRELGQ